VLVGECSVDAGALDIDAPLEQLTTKRTSVQATTLRIALRKEPLPPRPLSFGITTKIQLQAPTERNEGGDCQLQF
jgi:hypothetical protein